LRQGDNGSYTLATPLNPKTKMDMIDIVADAGLFVAASLLLLPDTLNKRVLGAGSVITLEQLVEDFKAATGKDAQLVTIPYDKFKSFLPPPVADELVANMQLIDDPGYYIGEPADGVEQSIDLVVKAGLRKPNTWKEFVAKNFQG
jgi:hypothetical protein